MSKTRECVVVLVGVFLLVSVANLYGQEKKEPPRRQLSLPDDSTRQKSEAPLPKIDPQEFVITGNESVDLPEASKTSVGDVWMTRPLQSTSPGVREAPSMELGGMHKEFQGLSMHRGQSGKVQLGYGSYDTPYFDGWFGNSSTMADVVLRAGYKSSAGNIRNADYRAGHASLSAGTHLGNDVGMFSGNRVHAQLGMQGNSYRLYGSASPALQRTVTSFAGEVAMNSSDVEVLPNSSRFVLQTTTLKDSSRADETSIGVEFNGSRNVSDIELKGQVALWRSFYSAVSPNVDPFFNQAGASAGYRLANSLDIRAGLAFYLFRGSDTKTLGRLYPRLGVSWSVDEKLTVYAKFEPSVQRNSLASTVVSSPYMVTSAPLRHAQQFVDFSLGAEAEVSQVIRTRLSLNYTRSDDVPIFVDPGAVRIWNIVYAGTTRIIAINGEAYADFTDADRLSGSLSVRSNKNSLTGESNPFYSSFISSIAYQHRFAFGLSLDGTLQIVGRQSVDRAGSRHLPAFTLLNIEAEYMILPRWSAIVVLGNLFDQEQTRWDGYMGVRRTISFGTSFAW